MKDSSAAVSHSVTVLLFLSFFTLNFPGVVGALL